MTGIEYNLEVTPPSDEQTSNRMVELAQDHEFAARKKYDTWKAQKPIIEEHYRTAIKEVQADEIRTFVDSKLKVTWLFTAIEVSSRLWISMVVGKRTYQTLKMSLYQFLRIGRVSVHFLFTTDGLKQSVESLKQ